MPARTAPGLAGAAVLALACGGPSAHRDAGARDAGAPDAGALDAGADAGADAGRPDASLDAGPPPRWEPMPEGPAARWGHVAVYDAPRDRVLVATGDDGVGRRFDDLWAQQLPGGEWTRIEPVGERPAARVTAAAVVDAARDRLLMFGGDDFSGGTDDVWALDLEAHTWRRLPPGPSRRFDAAAVTDGRRAWVFGGYAPGYVPLADLWELDLERDAWRELPAADPRPSPRTNLVMAHDAARDRLVIFGGHAGADDPPRWDTWAYRLPEGRWEPLAPGGTLPDAFTHQAYETLPDCGVVFVFGGDNDDRLDVASLFALDLRAPEAFARIEVVAPPPPRRHSTLVADRRGELHVFGGWMGSDALDDAWRIPAAGCPR